MRPLRPAGGVEIGDIRYVPANVSPDPILEAAILQQLPSYRNCRTDPEGAVRYLYTSADLNRDGIPETLVYLLGRETCGSGGCTVLILRSTKGGLAPVARLTLVQPPIVVVPHVSHGWRDIVMYVAGGGAQGAYHVLRYTGHGYPANPSVAPGLPAGSAVSGEAYFGEELTPASAAPVLRSRECADAGESFVAMESLGPLRIGLSGPRVVELLGPPTSKGARVVSEVDAQEHQTWCYPAQGITIDMAFASDQDPPTITGLRIGPASGFRTRRGIGIGSSYADVEHAYAREKDEESSQLPVTFVAGTAQEGLVFSFEDNHVTQVFLGAAAE